MTEKLILAIDDAEDDLRPLVPDDLEARVIRPDDPELSTKLTEFIDVASVILLDQKFNEEPMPPLSLRAADGASFVGHLRSWSRQQGRALPPVVLLTSDDQAFANEIPSVGAAVPLNGSFVGREFRIAPALDVEWVQHKTEENTTDRIAQLHHAFISAQDAVGSDGASLSDLENLLELPNNKVWTERAKEELRNARPPISQKDGAPETCGPSQVIRWLCHRSLPIPGMLLSDLYAAWALGVSVETFRNLIRSSEESEWLSDLSDAEYLGPLDEFLGRKWWRSGIDYLAYKLDQEASDGKDRKLALGTLAPGAQIDLMCSTSTHVVTWTPELVEGTISPIENSAQLRPPGWPAEALEPWILKADIENDAILQAMIEIADLP